MSNPDVTCWTMIRAAAQGAPDQRAEFVDVYGPVIRTYLGARWREMPQLRDQVDDAAQDVYVECFRAHGALSRVEPRPGGFRSFLYGVVRNVARRVESQQARRHRLDSPTPPEDIEARQPGLSTAFDRAWAQTIVRQALQRQQEQALARGEPATRRVEILRLRFADQLPIRSIAEKWNVDAARIHHEYATAREEFRAALREVVAFHHPGRSEEVEKELARVLARLR